MPSVPALSLRALTKRYDGGLLAVDNFNLEVADGEFFARMLAYGSTNANPISLRRSQLVIA